MNKQKNYREEIKHYFSRLKETIDKISVEDLNSVMNVLEDAKDREVCIFIMGNGGSAATASHYCCDFNKGISYGKDRRYKLLCLNDNVPTMMAYANDTSYDDVFVEPLKNFLKPNDVVIGISGSGNSANVVNALEYSKKLGATTIGFTGFSGGKIKELCEYNVHIPVNDMQITEDLHMVLDHCMMKILCEQ